MYVNQQTALKYFIIVYRQIASQILADETIDPNIIYKRSQALSSVFFHFKGSMDWLCEEHLKLERQGLPTNAAPLQNVLQMLQLVDCDVQGYTRLEIPAEEAVQFMLDIQRLLNIIPGVSSIKIIYPATPNDEAYINFLYDYYVNGVIVATLDMSISTQPKKPINNLDYHHDLNGKWLHFHTYSQQYTEFTKQNIINSFELAELIQADPSNAKQMNRLFFCVKSYIKPLLLGYKTFSLETAQLLQKLLLSEEYAAVKASMLLQFTPKHQAKLVELNKYFPATPKDSKQIDTFISTHALIRLLADKKPLKFMLAKLEADIKTATAQAPTEEQLATLSTAVEQSNAEFLQQQTATTAALEAESSAAKQLQQELTTAQAATAEIQQNQTKYATQINELEAELAELQQQMQQQIDQIEAEIIALRCSDNRPPMAKELSKMHENLETQTKLIKKREQELATEQFTIKQLTDQLETSMQTTASKTELHRSNLALKTQLEQELQALEQQIEAAKPKQPITKSTCKETNRLLHFLYEMRKNQPTGYALLCSEFQNDDVEQRKKHLLEILMNMHANGSKDVLLKIVENKSEAVLNTMLNEAYQLYQHESKNWLFAKLCIIAKPSMLNSLSFHKFKDSNKGFYRINIEPEQNAGASGSGSTYITEPCYALVPGVAAGKNKRKK